MNYNVGGRAKLIQNVRSQNNSKCVGWVGKVKARHSHSIAQIQNKEDWVQIIQNLEDGG